MIKKVKSIKPEEVKETIEKKIEEIKASLSELDKEKVLSIAKEKGIQIKEKCEALVVYAKEKGTPVIEKTAKDLKAKAADVVREVLEKLEK